MAAAEGSAAKTEDIMQVRTNFLGVEETVEVAEGQIYSFEPRLGGFEELRRFALIPDEESAVEWLQSLDDADVAFALVEPFALLPGYAFELSDQDAGELGMLEAQDALVRCVLTLNEDPSRITANLLAPMVFSRRSHLARQVILQHSDYPIRFPLSAAAGTVAVDDEVMGAASSAA